MEDYKGKCILLGEKIKAYADSDIIIAFSGGVDSSVLLRLACETVKKEGRKVYAVTIHSDLQPVQDLGIAKRVAEESGAVHHVLAVSGLTEAGIEDNPKDRCYRCKKYMFTKLIEWGAVKNITRILEGTNGDDLLVYRPGIRAVQELGIKSPLAEAGFSKEEVRRLAEELGISVAKRPASPCMATRFPYGTKLSGKEMRKAEKGELYLRSLGIRESRLRVYGDLVRIEVGAADMEKLLASREEAAASIKDLGYTFVTMDLEGFKSGSMDYQIDKEEE